jgi:hypothetical protein
MPILPRHNFESETYHLLCSSVPRFYVTLYELHNRDELSTIVSNFSRKSSMSYSCRTGSRVHSNALTLT